MVEFCPIKGFGISDHNVRFVPYPLQILTQSVEVNRGSDGWLCIKKPVKQGAKQNGI
jgi:hypothetical protein